MNFKRLKFYQQGVEIQWVSQKERVFMMEKRIVYVDNAATTPVSKVAFDAMKPFFMQEFGNASALYSLGKQSKIAVESSRKKIATAINAHSNEIFMTSGGTESNNWALMGAVEKNHNKGNHIITSAIEHSSIFQLTRHLQNRGYVITYLPVNACGQVDSKQLEAAITDKTILVSIMMANNEIGTILPIKELCEITHRKNILFHTDAVQAVGHIPIDVKDLDVDLLSLSGHKFCGPKGVGALYLKIGKTLSPLIIGGGQERGLRSGTTNTPSIVGMAAALESAVKNMDENAQYVTALRNRLTEGMLKFPGVHLTGDAIHRLPGSASFVLDAVGGPILIAILSELGVCASAGSACSAGSGEESRVLLSAGYSEKHASNAIRFSLSERNTDEDIDYIFDVFSHATVLAKKKEAER